MTGLGLALVVVVVVAVVIAPQGTGVALPEQVESISPTEGALVLRQTGLEIDMRDGYTIQLFVDGVRIPDDQLTGTPEIGLYRWAPSSATFVPEWTPGEHTIRIEWDRDGLVPDPGSLSWTFTAQ